MVSIDGKCRYHSFIVPRRQESIVSPLNENSHLQYLVFKSVLSKYPNTSLCKYLDMITPKIFYNYQKQIKNKPFTFPTISIPKYYKNIVNMREVTMLQNFVQINSNFENSKTNTKFVPFYEFKHKTSINM